MKLMHLCFPTMFVAALSFLTGCGGSTSSDDDAPAPAPAPQQQEEQGPVDVPLIEDGKYYLSAGVVEAFDSQGNKLDPQTLQITGDYFWDMLYLKEGRYQITASGSTKISTENEILAEVNCVGARDVYIFELKEGNAIRNFRIQESGCPGNLKPVSSMQMSFEPLTSSSFIYTVTNTADGTRVVESFTFRK